MSFSFPDVERAIDRLRAKLGCAPNTRLQEEFDAGLHPNLLSYQKPRKSSVQLRMLEKYLAGATSYLHQPGNYYDIFGAGRCVLIVELLDTALEVLQAKQVKGLTARSKRLLRAFDPDEFDSVAFELITPGRYALISGVDRIEFIDEQPPKRTPDFLLTRTVFRVATLKSRTRIIFLHSTNETTPRPLVSRVFGFPSSTPTTGEFGIGEDLRDIDED